ncbi:MAG: two-component system, OmpR family, sensor kinase [Thermoanaerobaculia bacterium]|jgi:heavy metal sensor kinase|nr:two-component system, OmpR family, sensor kinase [Thermoanaerobaculia bacterium]
MLHSVRARLTLWYTAILALVLIIFSAVSYVQLARAIRAETDTSLADTAHEFAAAFDPADLAGRNALLDFRYGDREILVLSPRGDVVMTSKSRIGPNERKLIGDFVRGGGRGLQTIPGGEEDDGVRIIATRIDVGGTPYTVVVARELDEQADRLESAAHAVFLGIPVALLVAAAGGYLLARKSLAPVTTMSMKARQIGAETLDERIETGNERDELGFLAVTLNGLLERLQGSFETQRRFMTDASHELRTPIAIIQGEADVTLARSGRSASEYRESIEVMQRAARKLTRIVQNLFLLARGDAGRYPTSMSRFYLGEILADCVRGMRSVAQARGVSLTCSVPEDRVIVADEELIHRLVLNLVENAVKFTPGGGRVSVALEDDGSRYVIRVTDSGEGIAPADRERIFERFYRGDRTRPTNAAGAGLGLPIARWIAEVHGGELRLGDSGPGGSEFIAVLPNGL